MKNQGAMKSLLILTIVFLFVLIFKINISMDNSRAYAEDIASIAAAVNTDTNTDYKPSIAAKEITYEAFGAVGDGVTDDVAAIRAAHDYANELYEKDGVCPTVYGKEGATYYVGNVEPSIVIKTDVDWRNCTFIIDDYIDANYDGVNDVKYSNDIFIVKSKYSPLNLGEPKALGNINNIEVNRGSGDLSNLIEYINEINAVEIRQNGGVFVNDALLNDKIRPGLFQGGELLVYVENSKVKQYIRRGANQNTGASQAEFFLINKNGEVLNEIFWDFQDITKIAIYPVDETSLTIKNGSFITYTNNKVVDENGVSSGYTNRGIQICRARVTLDNIHHMLNESIHEIVPVLPQTCGQGNKYLGFIKTYFGAAYFTFKNSTITPHKTMNATGGTYDISLNNVVNVHLDNISYPCSDGNDAESYRLYISNADRWERWGIMASNYAKDVVIENSKLNRIDSHSGIWNLTVRDSTVGQYGFTLMGGGKFLAENIVIDGSNFIVSLRGDYGSSWRGTMDFKNVNMILPQMNTSLIAYENDGSWDYGYDCYYPDITIQDLLIDDKLCATRISLIPIYQKIAKTRSTPYNFSGQIIMKNIKRKSNKEFTVFPSTDYLDLDLYGSGKKTEVYLSDINLVEEDMGIYNTANSQFTVYINQ